MRKLPRPLPDDPLPVVHRWLQEAAASGRRNPTAMALATSGSDGRPSVRMVLLKDLSLDGGFAVFYSHYGSRKGRELEVNGRAAAVLYWEQLGVQVRLEGPVVRSPQAESDAYFGSRPWGSQVNALVSEQSAPLADFEELVERMREKSEALRGRTDAADPDAGWAELARPPLWGGYRLWLDAVELWLEGTDRCHERVRYERKLAAEDATSFRGEAWRWQRLQP